MPQLNPAPWFIILIFSWLILLTVVPTKVMKHTFNNPASLSEEKYKTEPWNWPWH